jgi:hypothetical protein
MGRTDSPYDNVHRVNNVESRRSRESRSAARRSRQRAGNKRQQSQGQRCKNHRDAPPPAMDEAMRQARTRARTHASSDVIGRFLRPCTKAAPFVRPHYSLQQRRNVLKQINNNIQTCNCSFLLFSDAQAERKRGVDLCFRCVNIETVNDGRFNRAVFRSNAMNAIWCHSDQTDCLHVPVTALS